MRALVFHNNTLRLERDYPRPDPQPGAALIKVVRTGICNTDMEITRGYLGFQGVLGHEFVGVVEAVHEDADTAAPTDLIGKRVVGEINIACRRADCWYCQRGMFSHCPQRATLGILNHDGAFADFLTLPVANLHVVPDNVSDDEAVFVEPLAANFEMLEQALLKPMDSVLIIGDGKMGQLAAQVLALSGCEVMMVGKHAAKLALAEKYGVRPYLLTDAAHFALENGRRVDVVVECSGSAQGLEMALRLVRPRGTLVLKSTVAHMSTLHLFPIVVDEIRVQGSRCGPFAPALRALSQRRVDVVPLITARYSLDDGPTAFKRAGQRDALKILVQV